MTSIDPAQLATICGGQVITRRATPEQLDTFKQCAARAAEKSAFKPWTWGSPTLSRCFNNLIDAVRRNPPEPQG